ncbi:DUF3606 domain-containing protein [Acidovorax sp. SUPP3334]|uniref:DUF3606 domain-containing protein n=1 Tax=Acidovorax sp. SUPP3334 TaxID=2920881 RepID=UPI0023DE294E|nr:DUF3606 domain-containing protein [Acidovorax sp. SUPP3334]GKT26822.1 DUF3606 domain-containing protein [Acidovorax sp. SUPP3334]
MNQAAGVQPDRIDIKDSAITAKWANKLAVSELQLKEAVAAVGDKAADVEMHLKGTRSITNDDRVEELGADR